LVFFICACTGTCGSRFVASDRVGRHPRRGWRRDAETVFDQCFRRRDFSPTARPENLVGGAATCSCLVLCDIWRCSAGHPRAPEEGQTGTGGAAGQSVGCVSLPRVVSLFLCLSRCVGGTRFGRRRPAAWPAASKKRALPAAPSFVTLRALAPAFVSDSCFCLPLCRLWYAKPPLSGS